MALGMLIVVALVAAAAWLLVLAFFSKRVAHERPVPRLDPQSRSLDPSRIALRPGSARDGFSFDVVGEGSYTATLRRAAGGRLAAGETVVLPALVVPEPENQYDPNAIAVHLDGFGKVGYFSRGDAEEWASVAAILRERGAVGTCEAFLTGGYGEKRNIGVRLSLGDAEDVVADLSRR